MKRLLLKMNENYISIRENVRLMSLSIGFFLSTIVDNYYFALTWILHLLVILNIRRIGGKNVLTYFIRVSGYFMHLGMFSLLYNRVKIVNDKIGISLIIMVISLIIYFYSHFNEFRIKLSIFNISRMTIKYSKSKYLTLMYNQVGAAICEELYFRFLIIELFEKLNYFSILISAVYFVLFHYTLNWGSKFKIREYMEQFIIGLILSTIYYLSKNIFLPILMHSLINFPILYLMARLYHRDYINPKFYIDSEKDDFDELII